MPNYYAFLWQNVSTTARLGPGDIGPQRKKEKEGNANLTHFSTYRQVLKCIQRERVSFLT